MTLETILLAIFSLIPTLTAVFGIAASVKKFATATANVTEQIHSTKEYEELKEEMKLLYKKNIELQEQIVALAKVYDTLMRDELEVLKSDIKQNTKAVRALTAKTL